MSTPPRRAGSRLGALLPGRADAAAMRRQPRRDLLADFTVAIVALPLALGFGISSGLGAEAGLATAVVAGVIGLQQVPAALGVPTPGGDNTAVVAWRAVRTFAAEPHGAALALAVGVATVMLLGARRRPTIPFSLVAVAEEQPS
ncbi:hypothetical protein GCM10023205_49180 [Yinghuangia aomiensis]|uniref:SLC26A/SulP transporter domain-containing protein n=1 Tax=Yinghuangia aomiensis TaxID=676205 RepID=A0ABP9HR19_9ACTN